MNIERKNMLLMALFPYAAGGYRKAVRNLADARGVNWFASDISEILHNLMASIIRHRSTHYDECVCKAGKDRARFYIQGAVSLVMKEFKGN